MHEVFLSEEIQEYISVEDFNKLVSVPSITEKDINFMKVSKLEKALSEFDF